MTLWLGRGLMGEGNSVPVLFAWQTKTVRVEQTRRQDSLPGEINVGMP